MRDVVAAVDCPCDVKTLFNEKHLGCKRAVSEAIDWFFRHEDMGVILEDDCLPDQSFFEFCEVMLKHYARNDRIFSSTGNNFQNGIWRGDGSYYFSR